MSEAIITIIDWRLVIMAFSIYVHVRSGYLLAVVGGVLHTEEVSVGPSIQVAVLSADVAVPGVPWPALAAEHGIGEDAKVYASGVFVAVVAAVQTGVTGCAHLKEKKQQQSEEMRGYWSQTHVQIPNVKS